MRENFDACLREVLRHEGGWSDHPKDPGGATMKGVTLATYRQWKPGATKDDLRRITDDELGRIYRRGYWDIVKGDDLPAGLDLVAFDAAVNSGPSRGAKLLQAGLGIKQDGKIGPLTIAAAAKADAPAAINRACDARLGFLRSLKTWGTFGKGWTRRVSDVRATALLMAAPTRPASKPATKPATAPIDNPTLHPDPGKNAIPLTAIALFLIALALAFIFLR